MLQRNAAQPKNKVCNLQEWLEKEWDARMGKMWEAGLAVDEGTEEKKFLAK